MSTTVPPAHASNADELRSQFWSSLSPELIAGLESTTPGRLLTIASTLLDLTSHPDVDPASTAAVVRGLAGWDRPETSAGALAIATLAGDATLRRWARRDLTDRGHTVPRWLAELYLATPASRAVELSGPFRDIDDIVLGVTIPSGHTLTAVVRVDNELSAWAVGGALFDRPVDEVLTQLSTADDPDSRIREISAADARARLMAALAGAGLGGLLATGNQWRSQRCIVRWMLSRLPDGGDATVPGRHDDVDTDELATRFLVSPWGRPWTRLPLLVELVLESGLANGLGDPLLWSPHHVGRLLDPELINIDPGARDVERIPELLRDLIRYGQVERGVRPELTDTSLHAVDRWAPGFCTAVRTSDSE